LPLQSIRNTLYNPRIGNINVVESYSISQHASAPEDNAWTGPRDHLAAELSIVVVLTKLSMYNVCNTHTHSLTSVHTHTHTHTHTHIHTHIHARHKRSALKACWMLLHTQPNFPPPQTACRHPKQPLKALKPQST